MERRPFLHSAFRISIAAGALGLALASGINAAANHWRMQKPEAALRWRADDAVALTLLADQRQAEDVIDVPRAREMARVARRALLSDPLTAPALRQLAVAEGIEGRAGSSRRLLDLAHDVSRRDLGTSWLYVTKALGRGDTGLLLRSFDEASATSGVGQELMYPALTEGLFDPGLRVALAPYLREQRPWVPSFLHFAAASSPDNGAYAAALVLAAGGLPRSGAYAGIDARLLRATEAKGDYGLARVYLRRGVPGGQALLSEIGFTPATTGDDFGPFGWALSGDENGGAQLYGASGLRIRISADQRVEVARRTLLLPPGSYRLSQRLSASGGLAPASLSWKMTCLPGPHAEALWRREIAARSGTFPDVSEISVPAECAAQRLTLVAGGDADQGDAELTLSDLKLERR